MLPHLKASMLMIVLVLLCFYCNSSCNTVKLSTSCTWPDGASIICCLGASPRAPRSSAYASAKAMFSPSSSSRFSTTPGQTQRLHKDGSLRQTHNQTEGLQKQLSWADQADQQWRSAAASYAAETLHPVVRYAAQHTLMQQKIWFCMPYFPF